MAVCMGLTSGVMAQQQQKMDVPKERPTVEQMAQRRTERMAQKLGLNEAQQKQVYDINLNSAKSMEAHRTQMKADRSKEAEQMKNVLTTDQFVKWSQMQNVRSACPDKGGKCKDSKNCRDGKMMTRDCSARNAQGKADRK